MSIVHEQMADLKRYGLLDACNDFYIGLNGDDADQARVSEAASPKAMIFQNAKETWGSGEVQTLRELREFSMAFPDHRLCYFHVKGLSYPPTHPGYQSAMEWRHRMQNVVIRRWRECLMYMDRGVESVGQWWNVAPNGSYWAGNFWWATAEFINTLPPIITEGQHSHGRYEAELWIGAGPKLPKLKSL
jgi:hypothetical protein